MRLLALFFYLSLVWSGCANLGRPLENPWAKQSTPYPARSESIGATGSGCLAGAVALQTQAGTLELMRVERRRHFAHPRLKTYLEDLAAKYRKENLGPLFVGDAAQVRGGPFLTGHKSHQNGLDVDLWFDTPRVPLTDSDRNTIQPRKLGLLPAVARELWTAKTRRRIQLAAQDSRIDRILVHPSVKKAFCQMPAYLKPKAQGWMSKLRPWWGHDYHFHVRLLCDPLDTQCAEKTDPIPSGNGCDQTLEWWFSDEAHTLGKAPENQPGADPRKVPDACLPLLNDSAK